MKSLQMCDHPELIKDGLCMREFNEGSLEFNAIDICELHGKTGKSLKSICCTKNKSSNLNPITELKLTSFMK
jgi:hypothetical protein